MTKLPHRKKGSHSPTKPAPPPTLNAQDSTRLLDLMDTATNDSNDEHWLKDEAQLLLIGSGWSTFDIKNTSELWAKVSAGDATPEDRVEYANLLQAIADEAQKRLVEAKLRTHSGEFPNLHHAHGLPEREAQAQSLQQQKHKP